MFAIVDEVSCMHRRSGQLVLELDHLAAAIGDRWAPTAMQHLEEQERAELESESAQRCNSVCVREES
jgi:hypothetical protein